MQETRDPAAKLPSTTSPFAGASPAPYRHYYGTFSPPPPPPVAAAACNPSLNGRRSFSRTPPLLVFWRLKRLFVCSPWRAGCGAESVVAFPCAVQQQVFAEGLPVREPRLPFCGVGLGWAL
jgi:hypothetical protein